MKMSTIFGSKALQLGTVGTQSSQSFGFAALQGTGSSVGRARQPHGVKACDRDVRLSGLAAWIGESGRICAFKLDFVG